MSIDMVHQATFTMPFQARKEYYPVISDSVCDNLSFDPLTRPDFDSSYDVLLREKPSQGDLAANYALEGAPLSISGEALFEMDGTDGECRSEVKVLVRDLEGVCSKLDLVVH